MGLMEMANPGLLENHGLVERFLNYILGLMHSRRLKNTQCRSSV